MGFTYMIVNRRGGSRDWWAYNHSNGIVSGVKFREWARYSDFEVGTLAVSYGSGTLKDNESEWYTWPERYMYYFFQGAAFDGPYLLRNGDHIVIGRGQGEQAIVSVEDAVAGVQRALTGQPVPPQTASDDDKARQIIVQISTAILSATSTALSALGPPGAFGAGVTSFMASTMLMGLDDGDTDIPAPPSVGAIANALRDVLQQNDAIQDASLFLSTFTDFQRKAAVLASYVPDRKSKGPGRWRQSSSIPDALADDLLEFVKHALDGATMSSFKSRLAFERDNPDTSRYVIPELIIAIGLYVQLTRLLLASIYIPDRCSKGAGHVFPVSEIQNLKDDVKGFADGLAAARTRFQARVDELVAPTNLVGTPEVISPIQAVTRHFYSDPAVIHHKAYQAAYPAGSAFVGLSYKGDDIVDTALANLAKISASLDADIALVNAKKWPKHLLDVSVPDPL